MVAPVVFSSGFKVVFIAQTLNLSRNVSNFYAGQVVSLINGQLCQNLLPKVDLLSTIRNKFPQQRVDRER